jgi:hypothetical protein
MDNFTVILFKNKTKKKILKKFKTYTNAKKFYDKLIEHNKTVIFDVSTENGKHSNYEIALVSKSKQDKPLYIRDDFGRQVKVEMEDSEFTIIELLPYKKEELIYDIKNKKRLSVDSFIRKYLQKSGIKMVSKINNKICVQNESQVDLFSLKSEEDSSRFIDSLSDFFITKGRIDTIFVKDSSTAQKKYLYTVLESNGFSKSVLYRRFTTFSKE